MSTEPFIGEVKLLGFNFAPLGYMSCQGQLISIAQNTALFALLGTTYGGDGQSTFGLPDLQGRMPIGQGQGQGLPDYIMGEMAGDTEVTVFSSNLPAHVHSVNTLHVKIPVFSSGGEDTSPVNNYPAIAGSDIYAGASTAGAFMGTPTISGTTDIAGGNTPIAIMSPYLALNYSIAIEGIFPSRN